MSLFPLIAVDVGNHRIKCGRYAEELGPGLPEPDDTLAIAASNSDLDRLSGLLAPVSRRSLSWWIGSVSRPSAGRLLDWLRSRRPGDTITLVAAGDLALRVALERPDMVGIDRLLDALAANQLRCPERDAVVIDVGSAITVDLVSKDGVFRGGSILPGIAMSARALHEFTDLLPLIDMSELDEPPPALGNNTVAAMRSGLFWGALGAIRQVISELTGAKADQTDVFLTGGAGPAVAKLLGPSARHVPHLTLAGIALAARHHSARRP